MKKLATSIVASAMLASSGAIAAPAVGDADVVDNMDGTYTFIFDLFGGPDINGSGDGILYSWNGIDLLVTSFNGLGNVIQDWPANGGLGIDNSGIAGSTDNLEAGEGLIFDITSQATFDLVAFSLNGEVGKDGHQDDADGHFHIDDSATFGGSGQGYYGDASNNETVGDDCSWFTGAAGCFTGIDLFSIGPVVGGSTGHAGSTTWNGYVESITVRAMVPEPAIIALFGLGLVGLGFARRRRA